MRPATPSRERTPGSSRAGPPMPPAGWPAPDPPAERGTTDGRRRSADLDALPEGDPPADLPGGLLRGRVVPGGVPVDLPVDLEVEVGGRALPRADRMRLRGAQDLVAHRIAGEVGVALDGHDVVGLGDDRSVPGGCGHEPILPPGCRPAAADHQRRGYI